MDFLEICTRICGFLYRSMKLIQIQREETHKIMYKLLYLLPRYLFRNNIQHPPALQEQYNWESHKLFVYFILKIIIVKWVQNLQFLFEIFNWEKYFLTSNPDEYTFFHVDIWLHYKFHKGMTGPKDMLKFSFISIINWDFSFRIIQAWYTRYRNLRSNG